MEDNEKGATPSIMPTLWDDPNDDQTIHRNYKGGIDPFNGYTHSTMHQDRGQNRYNPLNSTQSDRELLGLGSPPKPESGSLLLSNQDYFKPGNSTQGNKPDNDSIGSDPLPSHRGPMRNFDWRTKVERNDQNEKEDNKWLPFEDRNDKDPEQKQTREKSNANWWINIAENDKSPFEDGPGALADSQ